jgi:adenylate cyclase class IV
MRNLEAKFRLPDLALARARALEIGFKPQSILRQRDTFYIVANGKLKLREQEDGASLIHYRRGGHGGLQLSDYSILPVSDPAALRAMLADSLGVLAEIRKVRTLMIRRNVRLHLDHVEGLGDFGEIEAVLAEDDSPAKYHDEAASIIEDLGLTGVKLIDASYFELLRR